MSDERKYPFIKKFFKRKNRAMMEGVYAGPGQMGSNQPEAEMDDVYADPGFFGQEEIPEDPQDEEFSALIVAEDIVSANEELENDEIPIDSPPFNQNQFMSVYAGPEFFSSISNSGAGAFAPAPDSSERKKFCKECGYPINEGDNFCGECGEPQKDENK